MSGSCKEILGYLHSVVPGTSTFHSMHLHQEGGPSFLLLTLIKMEVDENKGNRRTSSLMIKYKRPAPLKTKKDSRTKKSKRRLNYSSPPSRTSSAINIWHTFSVPGLAGSKLKTCSIVVGVRRGASFLYFFRFLANFA
jgi:hypothetical protein